MKSQSATYLAGVEVVAVRVKLGVVGVQDGRVDAVRALETLAGVTGLDDVSRGAVLALRAEAEGAANLEVVADGVDAGVHSGKLVATQVIT